MACDADLAVVMNIAVAHATAGPDADPCPTVPAHLAVLDRPSVPSVVWIAPFCATLAYFSTVRLLISTSAAVLSNAKAATVASTLRLLGSSAR